MGGGVGVAYGSTPGGTSVYPSGVGVGVANAESV